MKLWEMMKLAEENPSQKYNYKFKEGGLKIAKIGREINLVYDNGHGVVMNADGYEKVKQPVTWQEAIEAWANGGKIKCILHGKSFVYDHSKWGNMYSGDGYLCDSEILEGIWYIED